MVPVGATNVGSIRINFDKVRSCRLHIATLRLLIFAQALRTNVGSRRDHPIGTFTEAVYSSASPAVNGQALVKGDEMGGFCLGSTVVLVFEAPVADHAGGKRGFTWAVEKGQTIKMGQVLGHIEE